MRNRINDVLDAQKSENKNTFMFKEAIKTLLEYMEHLTDTLEKIDYEITSLKNRVTFLEENQQSEFHSIRNPHLPVQILKSPQVKHLSNSHHPISVKTQFSSPSPPKDLQSGLTSFLEQSVKLK